MRALDRLLFPLECAGCSRPGVRVCGPCAGEVRPVTRRLAELEVTAAAPYAGWVRDCLIEYKNGDARRVHALAEVLATVLPRGAQVVPVPSAASKVKSRGFDTIAELVAAWDPVPALVLDRDVRDQVGLSPSQRRRNLDGAMSARGLVRGDVVVVDDVVTTGSTMAEAARALRLAGASTVRGVSLCMAAKLG